MTTSILTLCNTLSDQIGDNFRSTTTSSGADNTIIDTALSSYPSSWINVQNHIMWDMITSGTYDEEERKLLLLATSTLTTKDHGGTIASGVTYQIHRLFKASDKRTALVSSLKEAYPWVHKKIRDESVVSGNWLKDGSFEIWSSSSALTYWTADTSTLTQTSTAYYFEHGTYSCKIATAAGNIKQSISNWDDLKKLAGKNVIFKVRGWCDTADTLRIGINDGTTITYSDYHNGDSAWTETNEPLTVSATIQDNPTAIEFIIYLATANTAYVDDARVTADKSPRLYIGNLGLSKNTPHQVLVENSSYSNSEPWTLITGITYDTPNGYMMLPNWVPSSYRLRILGIGYLDFIDSSGDIGTDWDDTVDLDAPQTEILVAQAAIYLFRRQLMPTQNVGDTQQAMNALQIWIAELGERKMRYGMTTPAATINYTS